MKKNFFRAFSLSLLLLLCSLSISGCLSAGISQKESTAQAETTQADTTQAPETTPAEQSAPEKADMNIAVMTGPTAIGLVKIMKDTDEGSAANNYHFKVYEIGRAHV